MTLTRRPLFFLAIAASALLLFEPTPEELRWVNLSMAGLSLCWFVLFAIEELLGRRRNDHDRGDGR